jgi:type VI secretion system Hcp family effector
MSLAPGESTKGGQVSMYIKLTGQKQGWIKGDSANHICKDQIDVYSYVWGVKQGFDAATGQPTGKRALQKLTFLMRSQRATPLILGATCTGENLKEVILSCFRPGKAGAQELYLKWTLTNARLCDIETGVLFSDEILPYDRVSLTFQKIQLEYPEGGIIFSDDWTTRV